MGEYFNDPIPFDVIDRFVEEYIFDFDAVKACQRLGYAPEVAEQQARLIMRDPGTHGKLRGAMEEGALDCRLPNRVVSMLIREANDYGEGSTGASRVSALRQLASILGMDNLPQKQKDLESETIDGSIMLLPEIADVTDWEEVATEAQEGLKQGKVMKGVE